MKNFYGHSLISAASRRGVVSYWRTNGHLVLINCLGGLPENSVARLTDRAQNDLKCVEKPYHCPDVKIKRLKKTLQLSDYSLCIYLIENITLP